jgi:hypothetical protein
MRSHGGCRGSGSCGSSPSRTRSSAPPPHRLRAPEQAEGAAGAAPRAAVCVGIAADRSACECEQGRDFSAAWG